MKLSLLACLALLAACGDNQNSPDASIDASFDAPPAPSDPFPVVISATQADSLLTATAGPDGSFYAAGYLLAGAASGPPIFVVKLTPWGALDPTFGGGDGIAQTTIGFVISDNSLDIATRSDGKIVVSAQTIAGPLSSRVAIVIQFDPSGELDPTFGDGGKVIVPLSTVAEPNTHASVMDLAIGPDDSIYVAGMQPNDVLGLYEGIVFKLDAGGALVPTWGDGGKHLLSIPDRWVEPAALVAVDDELVVAGTAFTLGGPAWPLVYRLTSGGELDPDFADAGIHHEAALGTSTFVRDIVRHGDQLVAVGDGTDTDDSSKMIALRFDLATGARDAAWGTISFHPRPESSTQRAGGLAAVALADGRTAILGSVGEIVKPEEDAVVAIVNSDGSVGIAGVHAFGPDSDDVFLAGAVSGDQAIAVGYKGVGVLQSSTLNNNSHALIFPAR